MTNRLLFLALLAGCRGCDGAGKDASVDTLETCDTGSTGTTSATGGTGTTSATGDTGATFTTGDTSASDTGDTSDTGQTVSTGDTGMVVPPGTPVDLGTAGDYTILAKSGISAVPPCVVVGDIAVSPAAATYITGFSLVADASNVFSTSSQVVGRVYAADYAPPTPANLTQAISDMEAAFVDAAGRAPDCVELGAGDISGMTLGPGVYKWGTGLLMTSDVHLSGSATDVWIFEIAQGLTVSNGVSVSLIGGGLPENVFWQVSEAVDLGTTSHLDGVVLTATAATMHTGASVTGRLLAQTAVVGDASTVVAP